MAIAVTDFSINTNTWVDVSSPLVFSATVSDSLYSVTSSGTYFELNSVVIPTTISGSNPYTIISEPATISGNVDLYLYIHNDNGDTEVKYYAFMYGYHIEYEDAMADWGPGKEVLIRATATNSVVCPHTDNYCTYFLTEGYKTVDLASSIIPQGWGNIISSIKGQKAELLYGGTYTITIKGIKDYSGNEMNDIVFTFTVENE